MLVFADAMRGPEVADIVVARALAGRLPPVAGMLPSGTVLRAWRDLLAQPAAAPVADPVAGLPALATLAPGLMPLALLRLCSGLDTVALAALLGQPPARLREALQGIEQAVGGEALDEAARLLRARAGAIPVARLVRIASHDPGTGIEPGWEADPLPSVAPPRKALATVACLTALALAATWWLPIREDEVRTRQMRDSGDAASRYAPGSLLAHHPDRELLEIPAEDVAIAQQTGFHAWFQAERMGVSSYEPPAPQVEVPETEASSRLPEPIDEE